MADIVLAAVGILLGATIVVAAVLIAAHRPLGSGDDTLLLPEVLALIAIATALNASGIGWGLPNVSGDWAIDSIAPLGPLNYANKLVTTHHWWSKYPPLHFTLLAFLYAPYLVFLKLTGGLGPGAADYPFGLATPEVTLTILNVLARAMSAFMGVGTTVVAYLIGRELAGRRAGFLGGLFFATSPLAVYYASTANLEIPYLFWSSLALLCLVRVARGAPAFTYVCVGAFAAAAIATKDQAYALFLLVPVPLVVMHARRHAGVGPFDRRLLLGGAAAVATYVVVANILVDFRGWISHLNFITHEGSRPFRMFPVTMAGYAELSARTLKLIAQSFTVPATFLGIGGFVWSLRRLRGTGLLGLAGLSYLVLFLGPILYVFPRFVLPVVFLLAIFAGVAGAALWPDRRARLAVLAVLAYASVYGASMRLGMLFDSRYAAERWVREHVAADALVGLNGDATYLPRVLPPVRTARVEIGTDGVIANVLPDYLILSDAYYVRFFRAVGRFSYAGSMVTKLLAGELGYKPIARFDQPHLSATSLIPTVSPRIVILQRQESPRDGTGTPMPPRPSSFPWWIL